MTPLMRTLFATAPLATILPAMTLLATTPFAVQLFRELYNNPQPLFPDIVLTFEDEQVSAHKTLLEKASGVFRAAFAGSWNSTVSRRYSKSVVHSMINHIYGFQELDIPITAEANGEESDVLLKKLDFCFQMYPIGGEYQIKTFQVAVAERFRLLMEKICPGGLSHRHLETRSGYKPLYREMNKCGPHVKRNDFGYLTSEDLSDNGLSASESEDEFEELTSIFNEGPIYTGGFGAHGLQHWSDDELSV
ncbi:hypothetical protein E4T47_03277 [Aureobasidium subglaciale]|nr:hypothetical protein E4T47_03277 [Aureobasidium subglaciale]